MIGINNEPEKRMNVKELIEEMRKEIAIEHGEKYVSPTDKPKGKPKKPVIPKPNKPKKPKRLNIFADKTIRKVKGVCVANIGGLPLMMSTGNGMSEKKFERELKKYNKTKAGMKKPINVKKTIKKCKELE